MDSRLLRYFLAVYESHGISAAADDLRISQPALTKSIQKLEADVGARLFERRPGGVVPTRYADILARRVRLMDIEYRHAIAEIEAARGGREGLIRIGAGPAWYSCFLPDIVRTFLQGWPETRVRVEAGVISTLIPALAAGEYDIVCASLDFPDIAGIAKEAMVNLRHVVIGSQTHPMAGRGRVEATDIAGSPWVVLANDHVGTGRIWSYFAAQGCAPPPIAIETVSPTFMYEMVARGPYIAHIPEVMLAQAARHGATTLSVPGTFWETPAGIVYRQSGNRLPAQTRFIEAIRDAMHRRPGSAQ